MPVTAKKTTSKKSTAAGVPAETDVRALRGVSPSEGSVKVRKLPPTPRADKVSARRRQLIELTMKLVQEKGFDSLSVNELAERASMSVGGLYRYIKTKSDLLEMVCDGINEGINEHMRAAATSVRGVPEKLRISYHVYWEDCWDAAEAVLMAYREWQSLPVAATERYIRQELHITEYFGDLIRAGVASGEFRDVDAKLVAREMVFLAQMRAVKGWSIRDWNRNEVFAEHWELIFGRLRGGPESSLSRPS